MWPRNLPTPRSNRRSLSEEEYLYFNNIPIFRTRPYELRDGTNMERLRYAYDTEIDRVADTQRTLSPLVYVSNQQQRLNRSYSLYDVRIYNRSRPEDFNLGRDN